MDAHTDIHERPCGRTFGVEASAREGSVLTLLFLSVSVILLLFPPLFKKSELFFLLNYICIKIRCAEEGVTTLPSQKSAVDL